MTLATTLAVYLGVLLEALWLWDANRGKEQEAKKTRFKYPGPSTPQLLMGAAAVVGFTLIGIAEWIGETPFTSWLHGPIEVSLMGATMFFILIAGSVGGGLLPRVNEYNIVSVLAVISLRAGMESKLTPVLGGYLGVVLLLIIWLAVKRKPPSPSGQVFLYLSFLGALVYLTIQQGVIEALGRSSFTVPEALVFGGTFTFLMLHVLFGVRFLMIISSFLLPGNRRYLAPVMETLFREDQIALVPFLITTAIMIGMIYGNQRFALVPEDTFFNAVLLLSVQLLFQPKPITEAV